MVNLVMALNNWPTVAVWALLIGVCFFSLMLLIRFFGKTGLYLYISVGIIAANLQVLKAVHFSFFDKPVALGTVIFASTYLCTDILAEYYGRKAAKKGVYVGFASFILWVVFMFITLGFPPLTPQQAGPDMAWALPYHGYMKALFLPAPIFLISGLCSYMISQLNDIWMFMLIRKLTNTRFLWLRNIISTAFSALIDSIIFSLLAWIIVPALLGERTLPLMTVIVVYIFGTYILRLIMAFLDTPFIYLAGFLLPKEGQNRQALSMQAPTIKESTP